MLRNLVHLNFRLRCYLSTTLQARTASGGIHSINSIIEKLKEEYVPPVVVENVKESDQLANILAIVNIFRTQHNAGEFRYTNMDEKTKTDMLQTVLDKTENIKSAQALLQLLKMMPSRIVERELFAPIVGRLIKTLDQLNTSELVELYECLNMRFFRDSNLLTQIAEQIICSRENLSSYEIVSLALSLRKLSFIHPRLIKFLVDNFLKQADHFTNWRAISSLSVSFSKMKVNSPPFWTRLAEVMNDNLAQIDNEILSAQHAINSIAIVNVPSYMFQKPIDIIAKNLRNNAKVKESAPQFLNLVYSLAILNSLTNYNANKVLQPEFFEELRKQYNMYNPQSQSYERLVMRAAIRILQIASFCRSKLLIDLKVPPNVLKYLKDQEPLIKTIRHGNSLLTTLPEFYQHLYMIAPLSTHSESAQLHIPTGTYVDSFLWVCPKQQKILSIVEGEASSDAERVAIIFGSYALMTLPDAGFENKGNFPLCRPLGELKMNLRHLHANKIKPVLIDYQDLAVDATTSQKILLIKDFILRPYEECDTDWC